jgi:hypothetical protein
MNPDAFLYNIVEFVEDGRFRVTSSLGLGRTYFVDLMHHRGLGGCDCPDFLIRVQSKLLPDLSNHRPCRHIESVWQFLGKQAAVKMYESVTKPKRPEDNWE